MERIKKLLSVFLVVTMVFTMFSMGISVSAENVSTKTNTTTNEPLEVVVTTNKSSYGKFEVADITVEIKNTSDKIVENINAEAIFNDLAPVDSEYSETSKKIEKLEPGESFSFSYKVTLSLNNSDVGFFSKIILWFVRLFNDGYTIIDNSSDDDKGYIEKIDVINFGNISSDNVINVWYKGEISDTDFNTFQSIRKSIEDISEKEKVIDVLNDEIENGNITDFQVFENYITFETVFGINGIWEDESFFNNENKSVSLSGKSNKIKKTPSGNSYKDIINQVTSSSVISSIGDIAVIRPYRSTDFKYDDFLTTGEIIADAIGSEIDVYDNANATLSVLKNLDDYGIILFDSHGTLISNETYICLTQTYNNQEIHSSDLDSIFVNQNNRIYISSNFFEENYSDNAFDECLVFLGTCYSMHDNSFSDTLISKGVDCVYGYTNPVSVTYCNDTLVESMLENILLAQNTSRDAYNETVSICGQTDPHNGNTDFVMQQSGDFCLSKTGHTVGVVKDSISDKVVSGVTVTVSNEFYTTTGKTDTDGVFKIKLPVGTYKLTLSKDGYTYKQERTINVQENVAKTEGVLYLYNGIINGYVKDETTGNAISGVTVEVIDNESDDLTPITTVTTDSNGLFYIEVPDGSYSLSFNHDNYEYYGTTVNVDTENIVLTEPVLLIPKNSSGGGNEDDRTVIDSGSCGADGDNATWTLYDDGELVVSGTGNMKDYYYSKVPWLNLETTKITITDGITSIGENNICGKLKEVKIPKTVTTLSSSSFSETKSLIKIIVDKDNKHYSNDDYGVLYNKNQTKLIQYPIGNPRKSFTIPNSVTTIDKMAFAYCSNLTSIIIPNSVKSSGANVFLGCTGLTSVLIPSSWKNIALGSFAFCDSLTNVIISNGVTSIGQSAFMGCGNLNNISIPNSVTSIGVRAFQFCENLTTIIIPNSVTKIGQYAFSHCYNLTNISIPNSIESIDYCAFAYCEKLTNVYYAGNEEDWNNINITSGDNGNDCLISATIHYNS